MVDRDGKNAQSWKSLNNGRMSNVNPSLPPFHEKIVQKNQQLNQNNLSSNKFVPGPGQYNYSVGFDKI